MVGRSRRGRQRRIKADAPIPDWLFDDGEFLRAFRGEIAAWASRRSDENLDCLDALVSFAGLVRSLAEERLETRLVEATTPGHMFDVIMLVFCCAREAGTILFEVYSKFVGIYPSLVEIVPCRVQLCEDGHCV